jgi:hypothetical protein
MARDDIIMLHFALGKAWLDAGDASRAFKHLDEGSRVKRATFAYDGNVAMQWMATVAEKFSAETMQRLAGNGDPSNVPVFVIGMPRSGTTLTEQILAAHPLVHGAGELKILQQIADRTAGPDGLPIGFPRLVEMMQPQDFAKLGKKYLDQITPKAPGAMRIVDKMPANFLYTGLIHLILPNARIVHCKRDAMDTCLSCYTKLFAGEQKFSYDQKELGQFYRVYEMQMEHWRKILPAENFIEVQYEEVVDDLETQAKRLISFIGLEWDSACLEFYKNKRQIRTASFEQVRKPIYRTSVGRWKPYAEYLAPLMETLGVTAS